MSKAEQFLKEHTRTKVNYITEQFPWITVNDAKNAVDIAREEIYEWLRVNLCNYFDAPRSMFEMCLDDLKQTIKDG